MHFFHKLLLWFAISERWILNNFTIIADQMKFNYCLQTSLHTHYFNKGVSLNFGSNVSEYITCVQSQLPGDFRKSSENTRALPESPEMLRLSISCNMIYSSCDPQAFHILIFSIYNTASKSVSEPDFEMKWILQRCLSRSVITKP